MSDLKTISLFDTFIYRAEVPKYLKDDKFMSVCNENTNKAIKNTQQKIMERQKRYRF